MWHPNNIDAFGEGFRIIYSFYQITCIYIYIYIQSKNPSLEAWTFAKSLVYCQVEETFVKFLVFLFAPITTEQKSYLSDLNICQVLGLLPI